MWHTGNGNSITFDNLLKKIKNYELNGSKIFVGSDSIIKKKICVIATSICVYDDIKCKGGQFFYKKIIKRDPSLIVLANRMFFEAETSINTAKILQYRGIKDISIHLDVGKNIKKNKTAKFVDGLKGYVTGYGFKCVIKPNAWASTCVADKYTKYTY